MSMVYPGSGPLPDGGGAPAPPSTGARLVGFAEQHIVLAAVFLIGLALAVGYLVNKVRGGSSANSSSQQPQTLYVPTSNTFENNYITTSDSGASGGSPLPPPAEIGPPAPAPNGLVQVRVGSPGGPPNGLSLRQIAGREDESLDKLYADNPFLGKDTGGNYVAGGDFNPDLPGNVNGDLLMVPQGANIGSGDPFHDGHAVGLRSIFYMNHGISHHVNTVLGA